MEPQSFDNIGFLGGIDCGFERYGPLPQNDDCPSMASSFLTVDTSGASYDGDKNEHRGPISPENFTMSSGASVTSPLTPIGLPDLNETHDMAIWPRSLHEDVWHRRDTSIESLWLASEEATMAHCATNNFARQDSSMFLPGYASLGRRSQSRADPPLSRAVFANPVTKQEDHTGVGGILPAWQRLELAYPPTVAPNVTFQSAMPNSPGSEIEPMTPLKQHRYSSSVFASSPLTNSSSSVLTSQWSTEEEAKYTPVTNPYSYHEKEEIPYPLSSTQDHQIKREEYQVKREQPSPVKVPSSKSGVDCEAVIPQNIFACSVPGCVDKDGKPKRFRRQEHKKRHEKTVHNKETSFACWVQTGGKRCDKVFTRRDNLNSHLKKTHGSRKNNQRNSYVATLDEKSKYFDEKWKGQLTADGLPVGHPRWPELC